MPIIKGAKISYGSITGTPDVINPKFKTVSLGNYLDTPQYTSKEENFVISTDNGYPTVLHSIPIEKNSLYTFDITISGQYCGQGENAQVLRGIFGKIKFFVMRQNQLTIIADVLNGQFGGVSKEVEKLGQNNDYDFTCYPQNNINPQNGNVDSSFVNIVVLGADAETVWWGANVRLTKLTPVPENQQILDE